jgi:FkbM family methyltransferase
MNDSHKKFDDESGLFWPSYEEKPFYRYNKFLENISDMEFAVSLCKKKRTAIQAGGHIGLWPRKLKRLGFQEVITFEPDEYCFECLTENASNVRGYNLALGNEEKEVELYYVKPKQSGRVTKNKKDGVESFTVLQVTIDSLNLDGCDFLCLDIEGHELEALDGAWLTINAYKPIIQLEAWPWVTEEYDKYMKSIGYKFLKQINDDRVYIGND